MEGTTHLSDYLAVLRRRRGQILRVAAAVFALALAAAVLLPPVYRSTATLLVEQEVSADVVRSTVSGYLMQRLKVIEARVLTPRNLARIARDHGLYPEDAERSEGYIAARMRENIQVQPISVQVNDLQRGVSGLTTVAFELSYEARTPEMAQEVAQELATLFIDENRAIRTAKARGASAFLLEEEKRLREHINELEAQLATYKTENRGRLPELMNLNMQMLERSQREIEEAQQQIYDLEERKLQLQSQLGQVEPYTGDSPGGRLRQVQTQYVEAASRYSPQHPDVVRLKRELETLKQQFGIGEDPRVLEREYRTTRAQLAEARKQYAAGHPDVVRLERAVASLEERLRAARNDPADFEMKPDNPAYVALQTQLDALEISLRAAQERRARAQQRAAEYEARLVQTPSVEQAGQALEREYEAAMKKYREIKQNLMDANLAVELEEEQKGESFSILQPANLPGSPEQPNRKAFLLLGLVLGIGGGIGYASVAEYMDRTVRGGQSVAGLLGAPPLAAIPFIPDGGEPRPRPS